MFISPLLKLLGHFHALSCRWIDLSPVTQQKILDMLEIGLSDYINSARNLFDPALSLEQLLKYLIGIKIELSNNEKIMYLDEF